MSDKFTHDVRDENDDHDDQLGRRFQMRLPSPLPPETEHVITRVIDCAMDVHRALGPGFLETIYERAMCVALHKAGIPFECEKPAVVVYDGVALSGQRVDLVVAELVVVELKAVTRLETVHERQVVSYLRALGLRAGLLINFQVTLLHKGLKRIVL